MKGRITVGDVEIRIEGIDMTTRQFTRLLREVAGIAMLVTQTSGEEVEQRSAIGFTAHLELDPQRNDEPDLSEWFEESP